ncbi:3-hydroxyadipyl-CoA dehydrogenase [Streptomyces sp. YIM 130001]|uniref:3-hydroxyacyl-CoA dehydrogenase n=1 Tax=Streptomyces sp. YIM 130001 TaxID=2259644 RepID=UPI000E652FA0|nr:3-hydroxyacyl-CoA dehydrogenase [Streptomyces sp. YIM 130001]RII11274.1 3-hydroxyadipyl-CoA dehydrogenase [Streptomyces sp. YIM 130001]
MTGLDSRTPVAVVGTGTMGQGIAQVALIAGHPVLLHDAIPGRSASAAEQLTGRLDRLVEKGRLSGEARTAALARLTPVAGLEELAGCGLVVEAVLEQLDVKQDLLRSLESVVGDDCLLATNTSSLSVTAIAGALERPGRCVGLHFFNPAPLLPLVEVVSGFATDESAATRAYDTAKDWGKTPVRCADTPGFIVNRVARPFYAEALRVYEEQAADPATIDAVLRECGGFRMGPFELTDLIGQDVNEAVTRSVWEAFYQDPKFTPSLAQRRLVESGRLGRKSGHGWFDHHAQERPEPRTEPAAPAVGSVVVSGHLGPAEPLVGLLAEAGVDVSRVDAGGGRPSIGLPGGGRLVLADGHGAVQHAEGEVVRFDLSFDYGAATRIAVAADASASPRTVEEAVGLFQALGKQVSLIDDVPGLIVARTVAMLVDVAAEAVARGVASEDDVDTAMRLGVNYPVALLDWARTTGHGHLVRTLRALHEHYPTGRYAPGRGLVRRARAEKDEVVKDEVVA